MFPQQRCPSCGSFRGSNFAPFWGWANFNCDQRTGRGGLPLMWAAGTNWPCVDAWRPITPGTQLVYAPARPRCC